MRYVAAVAFAFVMLGAQAHADEAVSQQVRAALELCPRMFAGEKADAVLRGGGFSPLMGATYAKMAGDARIEAPLDQFDPSYECAFEIFSATAPAADVARGVSAWAQAAANPAMGLVEERKEERDSEGVYWSTTWRSRERGKDWIVTVEEYPSAVGEAVIARLLLSSR